MNAFRNASVSTQSAAPSAATRSHVSLRTWAILLVLATVLPLLIFGGITLQTMARTHADASVASQRDAVRALASDVDSELRSWKAALITLANSQALRHGRLAEFYTEAQGVAAQQDGWIILTAPSGQQLLNTLRPYGTPLPTTNAPDLLGTILDRRTPVVTDLFFGRVAQRWVLAVAVPVLHDGRATYMLEMGLAPDRLTRLLQRQHLPPGWTAAIVDGQRQVVTRLPLTAERMGQPTQPRFAAAFGTAEHGVVEGVFADGVPGRVTFTRVTEAPWVVTLGVPLAAIPSARPVYGFLALGVLLGFAAITLAVVASRKLTGAVTALADNAARMLRGESAAPIASPTAEVQRLQEALVVAADHARALHEAEARAAVAQELRESEALLRAVTDTSPDAIYIKDRDSHWLLANPALLRIVGKPAAEAVGKTDLELYADPAIGQAILANDRRVLASGQPEVFEEEADTPEGRRTFLSIKAPRRDTTGAVIGVIGISHDITNRKQAEAAVANVARFPEENPSPVLRVARDGTLLYANRASGPLLHSWHCQVGQRLPADWCARITEVAARGTATEIEAPFDGDRVYSYILVPIPEAAYLNIYARDITARTQAVSALEKMRSLLAEGQKIAHLGTFEYIAETQTTVWSEEEYRIYGLDPAGPSPAYDLMLARSIPSEDADLLHRTFTAAMNAGAVYELEHRIVRPDGSVRWVHDRAHPYRDERGTLVRYVGVTLDVTERRQAEAALVASERRLAADLAALTRMHALSRRLVETGGLRALLQEIMDTAVVLMGAERGTLQLLDGESLRIVAQHGHQAPFLEFFAEAENRASACGAALRQGARLLIPDAEASDLFVGTPSLAVLRQAGVRAIQSTPMITRAGALLGILTTQWEVPHIPDERDLWRLDLLVRQATDLIETANANAALQQANATLEQRVQERTADLSRLTDQLRSLAADLTLAEQRERRRLADRLHDEHQQLLVAARLRATPFLRRDTDTAAQEAFQEIATILQEALEHSRTLTRDLSPPTLNAASLVPSVTWLVGWMREKHRLTINLQTDPAAVPASEEVAILLYQAVRELLLNVVKHAKVDAARLTISREDRQVRIEVADAGAGFNPADLRAEGGATGGFGLFSIQQRLTLFGGHLEINSAPGQGSRLILWAPVQEPSGTPAATAPVTPPLLVQPATARAPGRKLRVLLVDDHAIVRQTLARVLNAEPDCTIVGEAADGVQAVALTRHLRPDVVLMDVNLPGTDGIAGTKAIHAECPGVRVIGLSMYEDVEHAQAMRAAGAVAYLPKTGPVETLLAIIRGGH